MLLFDTYVQKLKYKVLTTTPGRSRTAIWTSPR